MNANSPAVQGSIPAFSDPEESEGVADEAELNEVLNDRPHSLAKLNKKLDLNFPPFSFAKMKIFVCSGNIRNSLHWKILFNFSKDSLSVI